MWGCVHMICAIILILGEQQGSRSVMDEPREKNLRPRADNPQRTVLCLKGSNCFSFDKGRACNMVEKDRVNARATLLPRERSIGRKGQIAAG